MKIKNIAISILGMSLVVILSLLILSVLTYVLKWQADTAMLGITFTYILAGLFGGLILKLARVWSERKRTDGAKGQQENKSIGEKMLEAILTATLFMGILILLSIISGQGEFTLSSRFFMIWMLLIGSACLGRIV